MTDIPNMPLLFVEPLQLGVEAGSVTSTVRLGWRNYRPGVVLAVDPESKTKWAKHIHVTEARLTEARNVESELMGYDSQDAFYETMRTYGEKYEDFGPDTPVTVIYFVLADKLEKERESVDELNKIGMFDGMSGEENADQ